MKLIFTLALFLFSHVITCQTTPYPADGSLGLMCWLKADQGVIGTTPISQWNDQSGAGVTGNFLPSFWNLCPPDLLTNSFNYNPTMSFNAGSPTNWCGAIGLYSQNSFPGNALFDPLENSIFMVKEVHFGLVELKWEDNFLGNAYRMGVEMNGTGTQRFDFVDASAGQVSGSTTNVVNIFHMGEYLTDANTLSLLLNGTLDYSMPNPGLMFTPPPGNLSGLSVGSNPPNFPLWADENISEVMIFNKKLTFSEQRRVESYLAIKYGLTLGNNQGAGPSLTYMACDETLVWDNQTGYHNYVIGIGSDKAVGASGLDQLKSKGEPSMNGSVDIVKIANGNFTSPTAFSGDKIFVVIGSNAFPLANPIFGTFTHANPLTTLYSRLSRVWAIQKTGSPSGNLIIEFDMNQLSGPNSNADIRLILDDDANFSNNSLGEHTYSPNAGYAASGGLIYFTVPYSHISAKGYFTLASADQSSAPLPVTVSDFNSQCKDHFVTLQWKSSSEKNCDRFEIHKCSDGVNYSLLKTVSCQGTGNSYHYTFEDKSGTEASYYKLVSYDASLAPKNHFIYSKGCASDSDNFELVYVTQKEGSVFATISSPANIPARIKVVDAIGKIIYCKEIQLMKGYSEYDVSAVSLESGSYVLLLEANGTLTSKKFMIMK